MAGNAAMPFDVERHLARYPYHAVLRNVAAVTCHFNPHRSRARRRCYQTFARQFPAIGLELFVAEGSGDDRWEVPEDGRVHRFRIAAPTCLFAKENLLNLAIERLPDRFESVLWIDADVLMLPHDFADLLSEALDRHAVVQGFRRLMYLNGDGTPQMNWRHSVAARNLDHGSRSADPRQAFPGLAWAARRELLARIGGLYDRVIMGGGDVAWAAAVYGDTRTPYLRRWSAPLLRDALRYVQQVAPLVPSVGCVEADGVHLFHGTIRARRYAWRDSVLRQFDYDPRTHLEYAPNGTLRWTRAAPPEMVRLISEYMHARQEDAEEDAEEDSPQDGPQQTRGSGRALVVLGTKPRHGVDSPPQNLAVVTPYFNFGRSRNRMRNYRQFAAHLAEQGVPLWTIEAALPGDPFDVAENERVRHVRVREPLWLSERLINLLWPALPPEVDAVAWVDADLLFEPGIAEATLAALRRWPIVQLFQRVCWLDGGGTALPYRRDDQLLGIGYRNFRERASTVDSATRRTGFAWAARRELLEAMGGLFDRYPAGGGDVLSCIGFFGDLHAACLARYGSAVVAEVRNWAAHAGAVVRGRVGYVPGTIRHLYHGQLCHRNYLKRHQVWQAAGFDPAIHLELVEGLYQFSPRCPPEIRKWTAAYLGKLRREDES